MPAEAPTAGFTRVQSGALITAVWQSTTPCHFASMGP